MKNFKKIIIIILAMICLMPIYSFYSNLKMKDVGGRTSINNFWYNIKTGGVTASSTSNATEILKISDFDTETYIKYTPNGSSVVLTTPASSTMSSFNSTPGNPIRIAIENATSTSGINITIVAGTGSNLNIASGTGAAVIAPSKVGYLDFWRRSDTDFELNFSVFDN